jgi:Holliday junction resolvase
MRFRGRTDSNQEAIVAALRRIGCTVAVTSSAGSGFPDLVVGRLGRNVLMECKSPGGKLTLDQQDFHSTWRGHVVVVETVEQAVMIMLVSADKAMMA